MTWKPHDVLVCGFNIYHSIDKLKINRLKWFELYNLTCTYGPGKAESVIPLLYFTSLVSDESYNYKCDFDQILNNSETSPEIKILH